VERVSDFRHDPRLVERVLGRSGADEIRFAPDPSPAFLRAWVNREAYVKAGAGVLLAPRRCPRLWPCQFQVGTPPIRLLRQPMTVPAIGYWDGDWSSTRFGLPGKGSRAARVLASLHQGAPGAGTPRGRGVAATRG